MSIVRTVVRGTIGLSWAASVWSGCGSESGSRADTPSVVCVESADLDGLDCRCKVPKNLCDDDGCFYGSDDVSPDQGNVLSCEGFDCCVKTADECRCEGAADSCALRADQLGGEVVDTCASGTAPAVCAAEGERCSPRVEVEQPDACCEGLVCAASEDGLTSCRTPAASEASLGLMCERAARNGFYPPLRVEPVVTSLGAIPMEQTLKSYGTLFSSTGCVGHLQLNMGDFDCGISLELDRQPDGQLQVTRVMVSTDACGAGVEKAFFLADRKDDATIPATVDAQLLTCAASLAADRYCAGGKLTIHFDAPLTVSRFGEEETLTFETPIEAEFGLCGEAVDALRCP